MTWAARGSHVKNHFLMVIDGLVATSIYLDELFSDVVNSLLHRHSDTLQEVPVLLAPVMFQMMMLSNRGVEFLQWRKGREKLLTGSLCCCQCHTWSMKLSRVPACMVGMTFTCMHGGNDLARLGTMAAVMLSRAPAFSSYLLPKCRLGRF